MPRLGYSFAVRNLLISFAVLSTLALNYLLALQAARIAEERGHGRYKGLLAGMLLSVLGPPLMLLLPRRRSATALPPGAGLARCPKCRREAEVYEGFCTECGARRDAS